MPPFNSLVRIDVTSGRPEQLEKAETNSTPASFYTGAFDFAVGTQYVIYNPSRTEQIGASFHAAYQEISQTLTDLKESGSQEDRGIEAEVYNMSVVVAAALLEESVPAPSVFSHGPKSVVFNWDDGIHNLYLTIGKARIWALASTSAGIKGQIELTDPSNYIAGDFLKALSSYNKMLPSVSSRGPK